jgi:AcrR family transcriptional regulator
MPRVTEAHLKAREEQILEAACKCFGEKGFHLTTMRDICKASGLSPGAVYRYFKGKDAIVEAMAEMGRRNTRDYVRSLATSDRADEALLQILNGLLSFLDTPEARRGSRLDVRLWGEAIHMPRLRRLVRRAHTTLTGVFSEVIRKGQAAGEIRKELPCRATAQVLIALGLGMTLQNALIPRTEFKKWTRVFDHLLAGTFTTPRREP